MLDEERLVRRVNAGEPRAQEEFFRIYWPRVRRAAAYFLGGDGLDADDVAQDTMIIAMKKLPDFDCRAPVFAWLRQICLRLALAEHRRHRRVLPILEGDLERLMQSRSKQAPLDQAAEKRDENDKEELNRMKRSLSPKMRRVLELRSIQGQSYRRIAQTLHVPMGTVSSRLRRAKERLKAMEKGRLCFVSKAAAFEDLQL